LPSFAFGGGAPSDWCGSRSLLAARSRLFETIGAVDPMPVLLVPPANQCVPSGENANVWT
jgi:hypothetical protein